MMFDATNFSIAVMTDKGFEKVSSNHVKYNYAWKYNKEVSGDKAEKEASDDYLNYSQKDSCNQELRQNR